MVYIGKSPGAEKSGIAAKVYIMKHISYGREGRKAVTEMLSCLPVPAIQENVVLNGCGRLEKIKKTKKTC